MSLYTPSRIFRTLSDLTFKKIPIFAYGNSNDYGNVFFSRSLHENLLRRTLQQWQAKRKKHFKSKKPNIKHWKKASASCLFVLLISDSTPQNWAQIAGRDR